MAEILSATVSAATSSVVDLASGESATLGLIASDEVLRAWPGEITIEVKAATDVWVSIGHLTKALAAQTVTAPDAAVQVRLRKGETLGAIGAFAEGGTVA